MTFGPLAPLLPELLPLLARMAVTASVVVAASFAAERVGPFVGAMVATLPLSVGPALTFLALDHGPAFVARSAATGLLSVTATGAFVWCYALVAPRAGTAPALLSAYAGWAACLALLGRRDWAIEESLAIAVAGTLLAILGTRAARRAAVGPSAKAEPWHLAVRVGTVVTLVLGVTLAGRLLGPEVAGYAVLVPVVFTSLILILQPRQGGTATAAVLAHGLWGMVGYGPALALLHLSAVPLGSAAALVLALATCVGWNGLLVGLRGRARSRSDRP